ncbi:MAG TPA: carboxylesterase family protein, partial [Acidimicrobiales bacterium]|nr:carboxylesterase family protein [Acidimicrobiales bacterium]
MPAVVVETRHGRIRGTDEDGLIVFRGVPYAAAPVGRRRFRPPRPPESWSDVRPAIEFGPMCPQPPASVLESIPGDPSERSEDCLTLNIWTPGLDAANRPVMVFLHGGGFTSGSSSVSVYHGAALARHGVVVITLNYRLGVFGWLAHPALGDSEGRSGFGNWGLRDQIAALGFVREHASRLGGDPGNVTIFGESAGAMCVAALLAAPEARGLFRRAIMQSGAAAAIGAAEATRVAEAVAVELGLGALSRDALLARPVEDLLAAQQAVAAAVPANGLAFQPVVDGGALLQHPAAAIAAGSADGVDLLVGTNRDEWALFTLGATGQQEIDEGRLLRLVASTIRAAGLAERVPAEEFIEVHRRARAARGEPVDPPALYTALGSDWVFRVPSMRLLTAQRSHRGGTYAYLFDWETPFAGGGLGSCHALELPFVFGTLDNPFVALFTGSGPEAEALSASMQAAWVAFARTGDPFLAGGCPWPVYSPSDRATMRLGREIEPVFAPMEPERAWLDDHLGPFGEMER